MQAADILADNSEALSHDISSRKVNEISIWLNLANSDVPTLQINKEYFLFDDVEKTKC